MRRLNELHGNKKRGTSTEKIPQPQKQSETPSAKTKLKIPIIYEFVDEFFSASCPLIKDLIVKDKNLEKVKFDIQRMIQNKFDNNEVNFELFQSTDYDIIFVEV